MICVPAVELAKHGFRAFKLNLESRKGLDKPVFIITSITLAILFLVAYYTATTGWINDLGGQFNEMVSKTTPQVED